MTELTVKQMEDVMYTAGDRALMGGSKYPGMTYEEGVRDALAWVLGEGDSPMGDDD